MWEQEPQGREKPVPVFSVDGYRNPVYADALIPRGLIGRTGEVLGCRAFVVLRDQEGHPLLVTTHRGDQHLTLRLPAILMHYEQATSLVSLKRVVVDREGMSAEFLAALTSEGWTVVTILRTDQYAGFSVIPGGQRFFPVASRSTEQGHSGGGAGMFWSTIIRTPWTRGGARQKWLENVQRWTVGARKGC